MAEESNKNTHTLNISCFSNLLLVSHNLHGSILNYYNVSPRAIKPTCLEQHLLQHFNLNDGVQYIYIYIYIYIYTHTQLFCKHLKA